MRTALVWSDMFYINRDNMTSGFSACFCFIFNNYKVKDLKLCKYKYVNNANITKKSIYKK